MRGVSRHLSMRNLQLFPCLFVVLALVTGCDQQAMLERFTPQEEAASARGLLSQLAAEDYDSVESQLDPSLRTPSIRSTLEEIAALFPSEDPSGISTVGSNTSTFSGVTTYNLTFEHESYPNTWLISNVVLQRRDGDLTVIGLRVTPLNQSLKTMNQFTFAGKGALHYTVFAFAIAVPVFIVFTLVLCFRTPIKKESGYGSCSWRWESFNSRSTGRTVRTASRRSASRSSAPASFVQVHTRQLS